MTESRALWASLIAAPFLFLMGACGDQVVPPVSEPELTSLFASIGADEVKDLPQIHIELPTHVRDWERSDEALVRAIAEADGRAIIGIKEPQAPSVYDTGKRAAVSAGAIREALSTLHGLGAELIRYHSSIASVTVSMEPDLAPTIPALPSVDYIEPPLQAELASLRPRLVSASQTTPWGVDLVKAPEAWMSTTGSGASIKTLDTGYDRGHVDLPVIPLANCSGIKIPCEDSQAEFWHGTHVLGIAAAVNNAEGVVGVSYGVHESDVYVADVCEPDGQGNLPCHGDYIVEALDQAAGWGIGVVNMSFAVDTSNVAVSDAVSRAWAADVLMVAAAGNNNDGKIYPAAYSNVIGVSGVKPDMSFADSSPCGGGSSSGAHVDLAAPFWAYSTVGPDTYAEQCGTSQAAPHVAGVAALVRSHHPSWTNQQVVDRLFSSANDQGPTGKDPHYGWGVVDAEEAVMGVQ